MFILILYSAISSFKCKYQNFTHMQNHQNFMQFLFGSLQCISLSYQKDGCAEVTHLVLFHFSMDAHSTSISTFDLLMSKEGLKEKGCEFHSFPFLSVSSLAACLVSIGN